MDPICKPEDMISLQCPKCGFYFSVGLPDGLTEEEIIEAITCPCGCLMEEKPFGPDLIPEWPLQKE